MLIKPPSSPFLFNHSLHSLFYKPQNFNLYWVSTLYSFFFLCVVVLLLLKTPKKKKKHFHVFCDYISVAPMKFGKRLKQQIQETLPGWRDKFLSYKELKKLVRSISSAPTLLNGSFEYGRAEEEFVYLLNNEIEKFNAFFVEQEEDFVIRNKVLFVFFYFFSSKHWNISDKKKKN